VDERAARDPADDHIRESAESFTSLFEATSEGMVIVEQGRIIAANRTYAALLGREPGELIGLPALNFIAPAFRTVVVEHVAQAQEGVYEGELLRADGTTVPVQVTGRMIRYQGRPVRLATVQDITERRRVEEALRASERRFRSLVQHSSDVTIIRDLDGTIRYISPAAERVFGLTPEELIGHNRAELVHPDDYQAIAANVAKIQAEPGVHAPLEYRVRHRDGSWRYLEGTATNLLDEPSIRGIVVNARDITERKLAEQERDATLQREQQARREAEAAVQAREEFLTVASHELKTPLTVMRGNADLLARQVERSTLDVERLRQLTGRIHAQLDRLDYLVNDLLDLSRLRRGQLPLRPQPVDFTALVGQVLERFQGTVAEGGKYTLVLDAPAPVAGVADEDRIEQVLTNLIGNAIKYSPAGGEVRVSVLASGSQACLTVSDHGIGIPPEEQATIFEPFTRTTVATAVAGGIGIGLYIAAQIVAAHGGTIGVESAIGCGSRFTVELPLAGPPPQRAA
jgi:PAS domain S-box-containing protein